MSANVNKVLLAGRVSIPPQLKSATNGITLCTFGIAINRRYRTPDGAQHEDTDFMDLTAFGKTADQCATYLKKGNPVFLEARLRQETWQDKNTGQNRSRLGLVVERVHFLGGPPAGETGQSAPLAPELRQTLQPQPPQPQYNSAMPPPPPQPLPSSDDQPIATQEEYSDVPF